MVPTGSVELTCSPTLCSLMKMPPAPSTSSNGWAASSVMGVGRVPGKNSVEPQKVCHPIGIPRHVGLEALTLARSLGRHGRDPAERMLSFGWSFFSVCRSLPLATAPSVLQRSWAYSTQGVL